MTGPDLTTLASGLAITAVGLVLLLQDAGPIDLAGGWLLAVVAACAGAALVANGLGARKP